VPEANRNSGPTTGIGVAETTEAPEPYQLAPEPALAARLMAEVARETRRRRAGDEQSKAAEREVDAAFERFVPRSAAGPCQEVLTAVERASIIFAAAPLPDRQLHCADGPARRLVRRSMAWYVSHLTQQANRFTSAEVDLLGMLDQRIAGMETRPCPAMEMPNPAEPARLAHWIPLVADFLDCIKGRVLHAECADGWLVSALVTQGCDAYGVDPGLLAGRGDLDLWADDAVSHLRSVGDGGLGGLVLSGCVDWVAPVAARRLVTLAQAKLAPGGRVVLMASTTTVPTPMADLTGARSMGPGTWCHLLSRAGFQAPATQLADDSFALTAQV
jgi:hypothetical protein